jgi:hypothetical protein
MPKMYVEESRALAERIAQDQPVLSSDPSVTRVILTLEEKALIVMALHCFSDVANGDYARVSR